MELFTALQMGRKADSISLVLIGGESFGSTSLDAVRASFREFKGERAECFKRDDKERLLAVVEGAFGDFKTFNAIVRGVFEARQRSAATNRRGPPPPPAKVQSPQPVNVDVPATPSDVEFTATPKEYPVRVRPAVTVDASPILLYMQAWFEADQRRRAAAAAPGGDDLYA